MEKVTRRKVLKIGCLAVAAASLPAVFTVFNRLEHCKDCNIPLSDPRLVSSLGFCRNCGGNRLSQTNCLSFGSSPNSGYTEFPEARIPFACETILGLTTKPCSRISEVRTRSSKIRKMSFSVHG